MLVAIFVVLSGSNLPESKRWWKFKKFLVFDLVQVKGQLGKKEPIARKQTGP
jgi:hypothetical protein